MELIKISIHAPSRERQISLLSTACSPRFQSTLPRGSDITGIKSSLKSMDFNPRSLAGATAVLCSFRRTGYYFNPRSLAGATKDKYYQGKHEEFQSTLPRGSDHKLISVAPSLIISIHAPSRERLSFSV